MEAVRRVFRVKLGRARSPRSFPRKNLEAAYDACDAVNSSRRHGARSRQHPGLQRAACCAQTVEWTTPDGGKVGRIVRGLTRVGVYVPGGTAAYPSSVLMNAVPAKVAGVEEIVMVTPPTENLNARGAGCGQDRRGGPGHRRGRRPGGGRADLRRGLYPPGGQAGGAGQRLCGSGQADGLRHAGHRHGGRPV